MLKSQEESTCRDNSLFPNSQKPSTVCGLMFIRFKICSSHLSFLGNYLLQFLNADMGLSRICLSRCCNMRTEGQEREREREKSRVSRVIAMLNSNSTSTIYDLSMLIIFCKNP